MLKDRLSFVIPPHHSLDTNANVCHSSGVNRLLVHNSTIYSAGRDALIIKHSDAIVEPYSYHTDWVNDLSSYQGALYSCSSDGSVKVNGTLIGTHHDYAKSLTIVSGECISAGHDGIISWSQNADYLDKVSSTYITSSSHSIAYTSGKSIKMMDVRTDKWVALKGHTGIVRCLIFEEGKVWSGSCDATVKCWDLRMNRCCSTFTHFNDTVLCLEKLEENNELLVGCRDGMVCRLDLHTFECFLVCHEKQSVLSIATLDNVLWTATTDSTLRKYDLNSILDIPQNSYLTSDLAFEDNSAFNLSYNEFPSLSRINIVDTIEGDNPAAVPIMKAPTQIIKGIPLIIKHTLLPNKRFSLSLNSDHYLLLHDLFTCRLLEDLKLPLSIGTKTAKSLIEDTEFFMDVIPSWCQTDINTGTIRVNLEYPKCTDAEWYIGDEERVNVGRWVLLFLFKNYLKNESLVIKEENNIISAVPSIKSRKSTTSLISELSAQYGSPMNITTSSIPHDCGPECGSGLAITETPFLSHILQKWMDWLLIPLKDREMLRIIPPRLNLFPKVSDLTPYSAFPILDIPKQTIIQYGVKPLTSAVSHIQLCTHVGEENEFETMKRVLPRWFYDVIYGRGGEAPKAGFTLMEQGCSGTRLTANIMIKVGKIGSWLLEGSVGDKTSRKDRKGVVLTCNEQVLDPEMTLATIKHFIWKKGGDVVFVYTFNTTHFLLDFSKMKLNYEILQSATSRLNPIGDRELDLRGIKPCTVACLTLQVKQVHLHDELVGKKIESIENLTLTKDQNDTLDFTSNEIKRLENFPLMKRLKCILASNNRIGYVDPQLCKYIPNLEALILTNNEMSELGDLDVLAGFKRLEILSCLENPVSAKPYYREYVIHKCKSLKILDFRKVTPKERSNALQTFAGADGKKLESELNVKTFEVGISLSSTTGETLTGKQSNKAEAIRIKQLIAKATTLEEIQRLEIQLQTGKLPEDDEEMENE